MRERAAEAYPKFAPYIEDWFKRRYAWGAPGDGLGEAPSIWCEFQRFVAKLITTHPAFDETIKALPAGYKVNKREVYMAQRDDINFVPWRIYEKAELERISTILSVGPIDLDDCHPETKFTYSAAARALRFLNNCTRKVRNYIQKIILVENEVLGWKSECHGRGFIPFCQENRFLHVERRVDLWRTVLKPSGHNMNHYAFHFNMGLTASDLKNDRLEADDITRSAGHWISETLALPSLGMPEGSYKLVFNGDPVPELSSKVFRIIQRDAAWQAALDVCYCRGLLQKVSWLDRRRNRCYKFEGLPEAMQMLLDGSSLIQCNFDLGAPYDIEEVIKQHRGDDWKAWCDSWPSHEPRTFQTEPPLPPWHEWCWGHYFHI